MHMAALFYKQINSRVLSIIYITIGRDYLTYQITDLRITVSLILTN